VNQEVELQQEPTLRDVMREIQFLGSDLKQVKEHLTGNGEPEKGLNYRVPQLERKLDEIKGTQAGVAKWIAGLATAGIVGMLSWLWSLVTSSKHIP